MTNAETCVLIDETTLVAENGQEDSGMSPNTQGIGVPLSAHSSHYLIVTMGGRLFALDASAIRGVLTLDEAEPPNAPIVHGVAYRGVDLTERLVLGNEINETNVRLVLLSEGNIRKSLRVSHVQGLMELQSSRVLPLPPHFTGLERHWYRGLILFQDSVVPILNTLWILEDVVDLPSNVDQKGSLLVNQEYPVIKGGIC